MIVHRSEIVSEDRKGVASFVADDETLKSRNSKL
jgi:hypothetical protein